MQVKAENYEKQHRKGKLHARERIEKLFDPNTFHEIGAGISGELEGKTLDGDGVITGYGLINSKLVYIYAQDFTICGGTLGRKHGKKIVNVMKKAIKYRCPIIGINDSGGARIQEGIKALSTYGEIFYHNTLASGYIPQISIMSGPCAGGAVYSPGLTDFVFVIDHISKMFVTGPKVVKEVTGEEASEEQLGGAGIHAGVSGVAHVFCRSEEECYEKVRELLSLLYLKKIGNKKLLLPHGNGRCDLSHVVPLNSRCIYDVKKVIRRIVDNNTFYEIQERFAKNIVVGFARIDGRSVGIVANQPKEMCGVLDCNCSAKAARFIRFCNAFEIPLVTLVDVPGFMPGIQQETNGIIRHGAKLLYAYAEADVFKITVVLRKAYGGAYIAMCCKSMGADFVYAWPIAEISVMGAEGAVPILYGKTLRNMEPDAKEEFMKEKTYEYKRNFMNINMAVEEGLVDEIIEPNQTREKIIAAFVNDRKTNPVRTLLKKCGNIPL